VEIALFLAVAVALYFAADFALTAAERAVGRRLEHRELIFFALLLVLALAAFALIRQLFPA
jgi:hypothetical protein